MRIESEIWEDHPFTELIPGGYKVYKGGEGSASHSVVHIITPQGTSGYRFEDVPTPEMVKDAVIKLKQNG